jgi:hypothetical protein
LVQRDREVIKLEAENREVLGQIGESTVAMEKAAALIIELRSNLVECMFLHNACFDNLVECQEGQEEAEPKPPEEAGGGKRGI